LVNIYEITDFFTRLGWVITTDPTDPLLIATCLKELLRLLGESKALMGLSNVLDTTLVPRLVMH
jgi:hypothetical protein